MDNHPEVPESGIAFRKKGEVLQWWELSRQCWTVTSALPWSSDVFLKYDDTWAEPEESDA